MRTIGLLGGMSWESTVPYYREINRVVAERLGGFHSARIVMWSVDFHDLEAFASAGDWADAGRILADRARRIEAAGADFLVLCTNTMHRVAPDIEAAIDIPLLHIADAVAAAVLEDGIRTVGLLGTRFTMDGPFYRERLSFRHGLEVLVPPEDQRTTVDEVIFSELVHGEISEASRLRLKNVISDLAGRGAEGVILGCTEIGLLVRPEDAAIPVFDSAVIHARQAAELALAPALSG
ncbi:MAG: aspartate/glutamate racemase family protein [marine benthic group bacterium]|jgi:aspartate racemase|nr:aspartate/glutamate racemase family protein [Gemmatimonadota bacterium]MCL7957851.1 aspartate/glutamate racemase family protein [Gemmatimonadota bacterium]MCL7965512.1 aspartate/glutamate racemase family protein [Gemmatimonadota bacterium]MCL7969996.1 aspartate/glutamate racemase family protein [Gemmatimonadota bacterium]MCL7974016.1 aspartate/glutamate racemase family protein [Gemmatimonadota bacterium]